MFNTTITKHESKVVAITKEIEKTISPDKVTEMYDAIREEVENNLIKSFHISSNQLEGVMVILRENHNEMSAKFIARYVLNGKEYITKGYMPERNDLKDMVFDKIYEHYKSQIASELLKENIKIISIK